MNERWVEFGDQPPVPSGDLRQHDSSHWRGRLVYGLRSLVMRATHRQPPTPLIPKPDQVKRLLVVQVEGLGDLVLTEPALRALRMHYPHAERVLVAPPFAADLFAGSGWGTITTEDYLDEIGHQVPPFDIVIDLTNRVEIKNARRIGHSSIPVRIGYERAGRGVYYNIPRPMPEITVPTRQLHTRLVSIVGAEAPDEIPRLPRGEDRLRRGRAHWKQMKLDKPVVLMPGSNYPEARWSIDGFEKVGRALQNQQVPVAIIAGPGELELGAELANRLDVPLKSGTTMIELMDLLATAGALLTNNTGPLHVAGGLQTPTVSTMGPAVPWRWWPVYDAPSIVFRGGSTDRVGDLTRIDPLEVTAALLHLIE
ncbi:glycosyltransferase family 9 protein [bacterium]|nr:glycosyltransferase family 9 protein [bacterium]